MNWTEKILKYFGFIRPYDFRRSIITISVILLSLLLTAVTVKWILNGTITLQPQRTQFVAYIVFLLLVIISTLKWRLSYFLLMWVCAEFILLISSYIILKLGFSAVSLVPSDGWSNRFEYHPLLAAVPKKNWSSSSGLNVKHNSKGLRGAEIDVLNNKILIHVYGGSTTYDVGVPNGSTWPEFLQQSLGKNVTVANFGVPGYSSAEHVIQTAFYSDILGRYPKCSIYYIGWNDIRNSHIPTLDKGYADFHLLSQFSTLSIRPTSSYPSPIINLILMLVGNYDWIPQTPNFRGQSTSDVLIDTKLEEIYRSNIRSIVALNNSHNTKTIFIGQILNREKLTTEKVYGWLPLVRDRDVWPIQKHFNDLLDSEAKRLGVSYIPIDIDLFRDSDFVDNGHFSFSGSKKFSDLILSNIRNACI